MIWFFKIKRIPGFRSGCEFLVFICDLDSSFYIDIDCCPPGWLRSDGVFIIRISHWFFKGSDLMFHMYGKNGYAYCSTSANSNNRCLLFTYSIILFWLKLVVQRHSNCTTENAIVFIYTRIGFFKRLLTG